MEISNQPKPSIWFVLGLIIVLCVMGITALYYAVHVTTYILTDMLNKSTLIIFEKGIFYLFGVGAGLLVIVFNIIYSGIFKKELSKFIHILFTNLLIGSVALTFALPQIVHYSVSSYLEDNGYQVCTEKSHRWLFVVTIVYSKNLPCNTE